MKINLYAAQGFGRPRDVPNFWVAQFGLGLAKHGYTDIHTMESWDKSQSPCDLSVMWGIRNTSVIDYHKKHGGNYIVIERGFTPNRSEWSMVGFNGLNGQAEYCNKDMPGDRWGKYHSHRMEPWDPDGKYVLILGQTEGDSALYDYDIRGWEERVQEYFKAAGEPYIFRAHPGPGATFMDRVPDLEKAVKGASVVVTYNSSAGVQSILQGKPTIALHKGSMVWDVSSHALEDYNKLFMPDRSQWSYDFAYTQWRAKEIARGDTWDHLKQFYEIN